MVVWVQTSTGIGRVDGRGAVIDLSLLGQGRGYVPRVRLADGSLASFPVRDTLAKAQAVVVKYCGAKTPPVQEPAQPKEEHMDQIAQLMAMVQDLQAQVANLRPAPEPETRRAEQAQVQAERREAVWINLGAPNGYAHPSGRGRVVWNPVTRRWEAYVDNRRLRKTYRKSFNARVAAGIKLNAR